MTPRSKPSSCAGCPCHSHGSDFSRITGSGSLGVMLVAEASGEEEQRQQEPLVRWAAAGSLIERTLKRLGHDREQFWLTNTLRCRPRNNWLEGAPWEFSAIAHCRPNLDMAISTRRPRAIVALGSIPLRELTGMAGAARGISHLNGYVLPAARHRLDGTEADRRDFRCDDCLATSLDDLPSPTCITCGGTGRVDFTDRELPADRGYIPVIPAYHPAFIRRGKAAYQGFFARTLQRAVNVASGRDTSYLWDLEEAQRNGTLRYLTHPSLDDAEGFARQVAASPQLTLSYDLETHESASLDEDARDGFTDTRIRLVQFSLGSGSGIALPWHDPFIAIVQRILHSPNVKCGHNVWLFDNKVLRAAGEREGLDLQPRGPIHDTLQMFHHWQPDLPAHLQFASQWVNFPFPWKHLAATDIEFYGCVDVDATLRLHQFLQGAMERDGIWECADGAGGYLGQVQDVRPVLAAMEDRGLPVDDATRLGLDVEFEAAQRDLLAELESLFPDSCRSIQPKEGYKRTPKDTSGLVEREFTVPGLDTDGNPVPQTVVRWCRLEPFSPNSSPQLLRYMDAQGHKRPKSRTSENEDGSPADTTAKKELIRLANRHSDPFYLKVIEYRELSKARGTYIDGFKPHEDGRVHTTFTFDTGTGQLTCCAPWTPVRTPNGHKMIKDIKVGELVWTHRNRWRKVTATWIHPDDEMYDVHLSNGYVLTCTSGHRLLVSVHGDQQAVAYGRKYCEGAVNVSQQGSSDRISDSTATPDLDPHSNLGIVSEDVICGVRSPEKAALLALEDGQQESHAGKDRSASPQLGGGVQRWVRLSDLSCGWKAGLCASSRDGQGSRIEGAAAQVRGASHRREPGEQSTGQLGSSDQRGAQDHSPAPEDRAQVVTIEEIVAVGRFPVHDITVEEDESYESCGVFSHNSRNPNIQNFMKHGRLAKATRAMIAAPPGHLIVEADYKAYHVLTTGFCAEDPDYMRLARLDMHSYVAGHFLKCWDAERIKEEPDDALLERFRWFKQDPDRKRVRDKQAKPSILGVGFGMGARRLYQENLEHFPSERVAKQFLDLLQHLFPRVFAWQQRVRKQAHDEQRLRSPFGHLRRFYEVFRWDYRKGAWANGDQAEEAVAFLPANLAFGNIRECLKELERLGLNERYQLVNNVHDSLVFIPRARQMDNFMAEVVPVMTAPSRVLRHPVLAPEGLSVDVEVVAGPDWATMKEVPYHAAASSAVPPAAQPAAQLV